MKTIITVQHPESLHHLNGMVGSWTDWDLSEKGIKQAESIAEKLKEEYGDRDFIIYSSDLLRASHAAEIIADRFDKKVILKKELRERNLGKARGKSVAWLKENKEHEELTIDDKLFADAESRRDEWNRLRPFYEEIIANEEENIIIVSHGDLLSVFNAMFLGLEAEALNEHDLFGFSGGVSLMNIDDKGKHIIKKLSDMSYI